MSANILIDGDNSIEKDEQLFVLHIFKKILVDPALTGSKTPIQDLERKLDGGLTARKSPIGSANHQWGMKKTPTDGSFTLLENLILFSKWNNWLNERT